MRTIFLLSLIFSIFLSSCAAVQPGAGSTAEAIQLGALETLRGMKSVIAGAPGTFALLSNDGDFLLLVWPRGNDYAMTVVSTSGRLGSAAYNALKFPTLDLAQGVKGLTNHGWKMLPLGGIPAAVSQAVMSYSISLIETGVQTLPTILIIPMIAPFEVGPVEVIS